MKYKTYVTNQTVWHGIHYPAGTQLVIDDSRKAQVYPDFITKKPKTAIWCFIVENGLVTNKRMQVWNDEIDSANFEIEGDNRHV